MTKLEMIKLTRDLLEQSKNQLGKIYDAMEEVLVKQIPRRLDYEGDGYADNGELVYDTAICRSCNRHFEFYYEEHYSYCPTCGQALDWSEKNA